MNYWYLITIIVASWIFIIIIRIPLFFLIKFYVKWKETIKKHRLLERLKVRYIMGKITREEYDLMTRDII